LLGLLAGCEKDAIKAEKAEGQPAASGPSAAASVEAKEVVPTGSASAGKEKGCGTSGCAPGKCGK